MTFNHSVECENAKKYTILTFACQNWLLWTCTWQTCSEIKVQGNRNVWKLIIGKL